MRIDKGLGFRDSVKDGTASRFDAFELSGLAACLVLGGDGVKNECGFCGLLLLIVRLLPSLLPPLLRPQL